ncbi:methyltransferase family protein [Methylocystis parvus]|uniref:Isoprenylcysteine carboxylmethyltransferase family protein n=1 Tax=Methylocystis parvus TaxID=134 RepID=A0A6B8MAF2_9HYPH|nr:isoprenylcysteine carboxylmethyltransferase family protein [Methylocystis parvus]QGM99741.1 isoprenylcysteine carboxylmethyltransferase family protein [Methylocystis parvus]WBK00831.1 isoprenylcysteine carboxylmethyltransferase family protein [Methylocystis parvus OBBP]
MKATVGRIASVTASIAIFLGLTIFAGGGPALFFANPARTALVVVTVGLGIASLFVGGNLSPGLREDRSNRWVIAVFAVLSLAGACAPAWADRVGLWPIDGDAGRWLGVALFAAGGALRLWPVAVLGHRFSGLVAIQPDHRLETAGVYGVIRHPSYAGLLVSVLGWGLAFNSIVGVLIGLLNIAPLVARIRAEERLLLDHFGQEYAAYRARTWRLIPLLY